VVTSGVIEITIGEEPPIALEEGDAISFSTGLKHSISNNGASIAILYLAMGSARKGT
jgi:quercetin dioxygenase-like cupin family protein